MAHHPLDGRVSTMIEEKEAAERAKEIVRVLQTIYDPEIPISIYDLCLI